MARPRPHLKRFAKKVSSFRRKLFIAGGLLLLIIGPLVFYLARAPKSAEAAWFDTGWGFRKAITVTVTTNASDISNLQSLITVDTSALITASKLQSSCQDLRFTNQGGKLLNYYVDSGCNTTTTKIWVMADLVPKNTTTYMVYMYYGNAAATAGSSAQYFDNVVGLVGYWTLNDASSGSSTTVTDSSITANNGTWGGTTGSQWTSSGQFSNAGSFNGTDNYVDFGDMSQTEGVSQLTYSAWVKPAALPGNTSIFTKGDGATTAGTSWAMQTFSSTALISAIPSGTDNYAQTGAVFTIGGWYHVVSVFDGTLTGNSERLKVYINGVQQTLSFNGTIPATVQATTNNARIGSTAGNNRYFSGLIDDVRVYTTARNSSQVAADYANTSCGGLTCTINSAAVGTITPTTSFATEETGPGPKLWWKLDDGTGTTAKDSTANGLNGTLTNMASPPTAISGWQAEDQCISGKCLNFDGVNDYLPTGTIGNLGTTTVSFWVRLVTKQGGDGFEYLLDARSSGGTGFLYWQAVDSTLHASTGTIYVDGIQTNTLTINSWHLVTVTGISINATADVKFGTKNDLLSTEFLEGQMDDIKIYPYTRTAAQVKTDYEAGAAAIGSAQTSGINQKFLSQGLVGYWKMDEASWSGTTNEVIDSSGNGNNGTIGCLGSGCTNPAIASGKFGNGGSFTGVSSNTGGYINVGSASVMDLTSSLSVSTWVKFNSGYGENGDATLLARRSTGGYAVGVVGSGTVLRFYQYGGSNPTYSINLSSAISTGVWHHIAFVFDDSQDKLNGYIDGVFVGSIAVPTDTVSAPGIQVHIGKATAPTYRFVDGAMDEVRLYNRALSGAEASQLYNFGPGPVGYWKMDEASWNGTSGEVKDASGFGNNGTGSGGVTTVIGKYDKSGNFDSSDDFITVADSASLRMPSSMTISAWIKTTNTDSNARAILTKWGSSGNQNYYFGRNSETLFFQVNSSEAVSISQAAVTDGVWHHVTAVADTATLKLRIYVDGVEKTTAAYTGSSVTSTQTAYISNQGGGTNLWIGNIDDLKIYNYARTPAQIAEDMRGSGIMTTGSESSGGGSAAATKPASATGYWKFDEGSGTAANNAGSGGSGFNGTLGNIASPATSTSGWQNTGCKLGKCLAFDGTDDLVTISATNLLPTGSPSYSLCNWFNESADPTNTYAGFIGFGAFNTLGNGVVSGIKTGGIAYVDTFATEWNPYTGFALNTWYHVCLTSNGTTQFYYVNGRLVNSRSETSTFSAGTTVIGHAKFANRYFKGKIDEPKVLNYTLTPEQVKQEYNLGSSINYASGQVESSILSDGSGNPPVGYWNFEEGTGTSANDTSGNANTGTWSGSGTNHWISGGPVGTAANFSSSNDVVSVTDSGTSPLDLTSTMTLESWVYLNSAAASQGTILDKGNTVYKMYTGGSNQVSCYIVTSGAASVTSVAALPLNTWHHVACTYTSGALRIYVDGKLSNTNSTATGSITTNNSPLTFGNISSPGANTLFPGKIDDIKVYDYVRTPAQIAYDYNRGGPVGYWKLDECQGTVANDASGNGLSGTITIGSSLTQTTAGTCNTSGTAWGNGATGKYNASLNFDGVDDFIDMGTTTSLDFSTGFTVSSWIYRASTQQSTDSAIAGKLNGSGFGGYMLWYNGNTVDLYMNGAIRANSTTTIPANTWTHLVGTWDGTTPRVYINGRLDIAGTTYSVAPTSSGVNFFVGKYPFAGTRHFTGQIDDVRVYGYSLSTSQIQQLYNQGGSVRYGPTSGAP